jgi:hypothetical protein
MVIRKECNDLLRHCLQDSVISSDLLTLRMSHKGLRRFQRIFYTGHRPIRF